MKYTFGTFLISESDRLPDLGAVDDLLQLTEARNATEGIPEIKKLEQLSLIWTGSKDNFLTPIANQFPSGSTLFLVARAFRDSVATADNDRVSKVASKWADSEAWSDTNVNPFDLLGMLTDLTSLCVKACAEDKDLYLLLSAKWA